MIRGSDYVRPGIMGELALYTKETYIIAINVLVISINERGGVYRQFC